MKKHLSLIPWVTTPQAQGWVSSWLWILVAMVFILVIIGGATRLTGSGLSIVEWRPIVGICPPMSDQEWDKEFDKYKKHSEFKEYNSWMSRDDFKYIYLWEYAHRLWARLIGFFLLVPFIVFLSKKWLTSKCCVSIAWIFMLGLLQGFMGWIMVKSGLGVDPRVSPLKLTAHLGLAVLILWRLVLLGLQVQRNTIFHNYTSRKWASLVLMMLITFLYGGLVAGHKAGLIYNTYPLMGDRWVPAEVSALNPLWTNLFWNPVTVQFIHRSLGGGIVLTWVLLLCSKKDLSYDKRWSYFLTFATFIQAGIGILTLLLARPVLLAIAHQTWGVVTIVLALVSLYKIPIGHKKSKRKDITRREKIALG